MLLLLSYQASEAEVESPSSSGVEKTEAVLQSPKRALSFSYGKRNSRAFSISEGRKSDNTDSKSKSGESCLLLSLLSLLAWPTTFM